MPEYGYFYLVIFRMILYTLDSLRQYSAARAFTLWPAAYASQIC